MVHIAALEAHKFVEMAIYQLHVIQLVALQWDKAPTKISAKYNDYMDIIAYDLVIELSKNISINKNAIELVEGKQLLYDPIYTFGIIELEILKIYIKTYLKTSFIQPSKFSASALSFLIKSLTEVFVCLLINKTSTILGSKTNICFF